MRNEVETNVFIRIGNDSHNSRHSSRTAHIHKRAKLWSAGSIHRLQVAQVGQEKKAGLKLAHEVSDCPQTTPYVLNSNVMTVTNGQNSPRFVHFA